MAEAASAATYESAQAAPDIAASHGMDEFSRVPIRGGGEDVWEAQPRLELLSYGFP